MERLVTDGRVIGVTTGQPSLVNWSKGRNLELEVSLLSGGFSGSLPRSFLSCGFHLQFGGKGKAGPNLKSPDADDDCEGPLVRRLPLHTVTGELD